MSVGSFINTQRLGDNADWLDGVDTKPFRPVRDFHWRRARCEFTCTRCNFYVARLVRTW